MGALETTENEITYTGDGVSVAFEFPYLFYDEDDLKVYLNDTTNSDPAVLLTIETDYTVSGAGDDAGGIVTMETAPAGPADPEELIIEREVPETQESKYTNYNRFPAPTVEKGLNRLTMMVQQLTGKLGRMIGFDISVTPIGDLPPPEADTVIGYNSTGTEFENKVIAGNNLTIPSSGMLASQGTTSLLGRTITALGKIKVTDGNGLSGNPTVESTEIDDFLSKTNVNRGTWTCDSQTQVVIDSGFQFQGVDSGKIFTFASSRTFDISGTPGDLGALDTGESETADTWYYLIALGDTTGATDPHIIGVSEASYATFTTARLVGNYAAYGDYKRIGAIRNDAGSDLLEGRFVDGTFYPEDVLNHTVTETLNSWAPQDFSPFIPPIVREGYFWFRNGANVTSSIRYTGSGGQQNVTLINAAMSNSKVLLDSSQAFDAQVASGTLNSHVISYADDLMTEGQ